AYEELTRDEKDQGCFDKLYGTDIKFGTSGVRELIKCGFSSINHAVIFVITKGIKKFLEDNCSDNLEKNGVIIGYDGRKYSKEFAELVACTFAAEGVKNIRLFSKVVPTPTLAYSANHFECALGVMITASHNSKEYNGYKVYDSRGCFITPPLDGKMLESILSYLRNCKKTDSKNVAELLSKFPKFEDPYELIFKKFLDDIITQCSLLGPKGEKSSVGICYSAMHGCGNEFVTKIMNLCNFTKFVSVKEQAEPDEKFSTVADPNPEVGWNTFKLACETADKNNAKVVLINDPDADRLGMAEKIDNEWMIYSGNQMSMVLLDWLLKEKYSKCASKCAVAYSTVSTNFPMTLERIYNFKRYETLTGFKFLGECMRESETKGIKPILSFEESLGFLVGTHVYDKDGVSAALLFSELAESCYKDGKTVYSYWIELMNKYGYHMSYNKYYKLENMDVLQKIFDSIRYSNCKNGDKSLDLENYPKKLGGKYDVVGVRDLAIGFDTTKSDKRPILPVSKSNHMITFYTAQNLTLTIRGSGTEPKLKFYLGQVFDVNYQVNDPNKLIEKMREDSILILDELLQPKEFGL
ncbi:MAG: Phosphoglucomutase-2, partial [Paramarteilia canceri]